MSASTEQFFFSLQDALDGVCCVAPRGRVLAAWSGGPDSTAMVWALQKLSQEGRIQLEAAHIHHGLRSDSDQELESVRKWADLWSVPLHVHRLNLDPDQAGLQARARDARYQALFAIAHAQNCPHLATGHTRDDQIETVLMRLLRGAGVRGLRAVLPRTQDGRIRPMLAVDRATIETVLREHGLAFVRDPSNHDPKYMRTRVRHQLLPALRDTDDRVLERLVEITTQAQELWSTVETDLNHVNFGRALPVETLHQLPDFAWGAALERWLGAECDRKHVDAIRRLSEPSQPSRRVSAPGSRTVHRVGGYLVAGPRSGPADFPEAFRDIVPLGRYMTDLSQPEGGEETEWKATHDGRKQRFKNRMRRLGIPDALRSIWPALWSGEKVVGLLGEAVITEMCGIELPRELFKHVKSG